MRHKLKELGVALGAVLVLGGVFATAAPAEETPEYFHSHDAERVAIEGVTLEPTVVYPTTSESTSNTTCGEIEAAGELIGTEHDNGEVVSYTAEALTVGFQQTSCALVGATPFGATTDDEDCHYLISATTGGEPGHANVSLTCDSGSMRITSPEIGMTIDIPNQEFPNAVRFANVEQTSGHGAIQVAATAEMGTQFTCAPAFICALLGIPTEGTAGSYFTSMVLTGYEAEGEPDPTGPEHGEQVDIWQGPTK